MSEANTASDADGSVVPLGVRPTEGGDVGTAHQDLLDLLEQALFRTRKNFGMYGQIQISIRDVTTHRLTVGISTHHPLDGATVALNVRNAVLNWLQDLLPVQRFVAVYENRTLGVSSEVHDLPFVGDLSMAGELRSSEILIEQHAGPAREELRPKFGEVWRRFVEEETR